MKDKPQSVLVISSKADMQEISKVALEDHKYRVIEATNPNEARLKYANEDFNLILIDMNLTGLKAKEFVEGIRRKDKNKNIKTLRPVLVTGDEAKDFMEDFGEFDNVKFIQTPFTKPELKKKLFEFGANSEIIANNTRIIEKDEYLITEGGTSHEMYWILSGEFNITKLNQDDNNVIIGKVYPGELVGEMSFLDNLPRSASVRALVDSEVLVIPHKKFIDVVDKQPRWFRSLMQTLSQRLRNSNRIIARKIAELDPTEDAMLGSTEMIDQYDDDDDFTKPEV